MSLLAFDTETRGLDWFNPERSAFLASWASEHDSGVANLDTQEGRESFLRVIEQADTLVAHNLPFDVHMLREKTGRDLLTTGQRLVDTAITARVVVPERRSGEDNEAGFGLDALSKTYLPAHEQKINLDELAKAAGLRTLNKDGAYYELWRAYPQEFEEYARMDTVATRALLPKLEAKITERNRPVVELEREVQQHLIRAEQVGVRVDQSKVEPLKADYELRAEQSREAVVAVLGEDALEGDAALLEALLEHGVPLYRTTPTGKQLSTNKFALAEFADRFAVIDALQEYRTAEKFLSTYIGPMVGRDTVHTSFWQIGAWTGRMSCSRPNMQNIPVRAGSEVREVFVPREGHSFVVCDFDSIELRLLAYYLNREVFREKVARGDDTFAELAAHVAPVLGYDVDYGTDPDGYRKGAPGEKKRGDCKNVTYAITYGAGAKRVADMLGIRPAEAKAVVNTVKGWLPGYWDLAGRDGRIPKKVRGSGYVTTIMGRKQPVNREKSYVGLNALIQGSAADIMKQAIILVAERTKHLGAVPILFVHDEVLNECPTEYAEEVLEIQQQAMIDAWDLNPPLAVSGTIAHNSYAEGK